MTREANPVPYPLERLKQLPFVTGFKYGHGRKSHDTGYDGVIEIQTPTGLFNLTVEEEKLWKPVFGVLVSPSPAAQKHGRIVLARHIPRQLAETLINAKVNFADEAGNTHITLGGAYNWTVIGIPPLERISERRPVTPAQLQLLFQFATQPESVDWPVRRLEPAAGISKSRAAQARQQLAATGLLTKTGKRYQLAAQAVLESHLISGYCQILRPKLTVGRFRCAEPTADAFLSRLRKQAPAGLQYSITGGKAAELLQNFYKGPDATLFVTEPAAARQLRLLPDREGPITLLRAFGELVNWEKRGDHMLAPPWLIYAELMSSTDDRAHEAAEEIRKEFLADAG